MESFATGLRIFQDLAEEPRMEKKAKKEGGFVFPEPKRKKARKNLTLDLKPKETSEHVEFDVDAFLDSIPRPPPQCPRCLNDLTMGLIQHGDGSQWEYYGCPTTRFDTKCYVTCSRENLATYLKAVEEQTHPVYAQIPPERFKCQCDMSMILTMSKSEKNPGRLYLKCPKRRCELFQWINEPPQGLAFKLLQAQDFL